MSVATEAYTGNRFGSGCNSYADTSRSFLNPINKSIIPASYVASSEPQRWNGRRPSVVSTNSSTDTNPSSTNSYPSVEGKESDTSVPSTPDEHSWPKRALKSLKRKCSISNLTSTPSKPCESRWVPASERYTGLELPSDTRSELEMSEAWVYSMTEGEPSSVLSRVFKNLAAMSMNEGRRGLYGEFIGDDEYKAKHLLDQIQRLERYESEASKRSSPIDSGVSATSQQSKPFDPRILADQDSEARETGGDFIKSKKQSDNQDDSSQTDTQYMMSGGIP